MKGFEIRAATTEHLDGVRTLARHLNTVNLPDDPAAIAALLETSERSFAREIEAPNRREYVFVLLDRELDKVVGTSMVFGQLGRRDAPYIYFDVRKKEKYSATLDKHLVHTILATTYSYDGPTEIGGLVVRPEFRKRPERLGTLISSVRFMFIAMRRADMQDELLAELLPPLEANGRSRLWEAVGARYTGLSYREADRLSKGNKEFIKGLFPEQIHATLLSDEAQAVIGAVGEKTQGVRQLLERIGFSYANRVDPFDGGPHFMADTDRVSLVQGSREVVVRPGPPEAGGEALLATESQGFPYFKAVRGVATLEPNGARVDQESLTALEAGTGDRLWLLPL